MHKIVPFKKHFSGGGHAPEPPMFEHGFTPLAITNSKF